MAYLINTTETYRMANENEATNFLNSLKEKGFEIIKYSSIKKQKKHAGEIEDEWIRLSVTLGFNDEKEPDRFISVNYEGE